MPEEQPETEEVTKRRSQLKRELDAFAEIVRILKPLNAEQRTRLIASANALLGE